MTNEIEPNRLKSIIERIERLEEEESALRSDKKEVYAEAKATGFDTKILKQVIKLRKMTSEDRNEQEMLLDTYISSLGGL